MTESIWLSEITESGTNPRQTAANVLELSESMAEQGLIQPIIVRKIDEGRYECVVGSRRLAAAKLLQWNSIPCIVQDYNDDQVAEIQLVENLQREDVHPLEEAKAIKNMMDKNPKLTAKHVADRIGKTEKFVRQRNSLNNLCEQVKAEFLIGKLNLAQANLFATVDHEKQALVMGKAINGGFENEERFYDSVGRIKHYIQNLFKELDSAFFPRGLEYAGQMACSKCPKNSSNGNNLFEFEDEGAMCSDATCFAIKQSHFLTTTIADYMDFCKSIGQEKTFFISATRYGTSYSITELALAGKQYPDHSFHRCALAGYAQAEPNPGAPFVAGLILPTSGEDGLEHDTYQLFDIVWACTETEAKEAPAAKIEAIEKELASIDDDQTEPTPNGPTKEERKRQLSFLKYEQEMAIYNDAEREYRWEIEQRHEKIERNVVVAHWQELVESYGTNAMVTDIAAKASAFWILYKSSPWSYSEHCVDFLADVLDQNPTWVPNCYTDGLDKPDHALDLLAAELDNRAKARTLLNRNQVMTTWEAILVAPKELLDKAIARTALGLCILPMGVGYPPFPFIPLRDSIIEALPSSPGLLETIASTIPIPEAPIEPIMPDGYEPGEADDEDDED